MPETNLTKICSKCKAIKEATLENFGPHKGTKSGYQSQCRVCRKEWKRQFYYSEEGRAKFLSEEHRSRCRAYSQSPAGQARLKRYMKSESGKEIYRRSNKKFKSTELGKLRMRQAGKRARLRYPEKAIARCRISNAVASGKVIKPAQCVLCNSEGRLESHHYLGYSPEHWYDVQWLCVRCHKKADLKLSGSQKTFDGSDMSVQC